MRIEVYDAQRARKTYPNSYPSEAIVEVWDGNNILACVYVAKDDNGEVGILIERDGEPVQQFFVTRDG
jgi:hypothetical protein